MIKLEILLLQLINTAHHILSNQDIILVQIQIIEDINVKKDGKIKHIESNLWMISTQGKQIKEWKNNFNNLKEKEWRGYSDKQCRKHSETILVNILKNITNRWWRNKHKWGVSTNNKKRKEWKKNTKISENIKTKVIVIWAKKWKDSWIKWLKTLQQMWKKLWRWESL